MIAEPYIRNVSWIRKIPKGLIEKGEGIQRHRLGDALSAEFRGIKAFLLRQEGYSQLAQDTSSENTAIDFSIFRRGRDRCLISVALQLTACIAGPDSVAGKNRYRTHNSHKGDKHDMEH